ncbi:MAG: VanZ family protein, partial [Planctomycetota bacterium]
RFSMALSRRQKLTIAALLFYWSVIFVLSHIPIPQIFIGNIAPSDKTLHYLAYLVLSFLLWLAINPGKKVQWGKAAVWWVLLVVIWYGVFDEWLQSYVGRNADIRDFFADLAGAVTGLVLLTVFSFWPASVVLTGAIIFFLINFLQAGMAEQLPVASAAIYLFVYILFSLLWLQYIYHHLPIRAPESKWLAGALALPIGLLLVVELFCSVVGNGFNLLRVVIASTGIVAVVISIYLIALFRSSLTKKVSSNGC